MVELTGLQSQTMYEVQVCLQDDFTNCGGCVRCFETQPAIGMNDLTSLELTTS